MQKRTRTLVNTAKVLLEKHYDRERDCIKKFKVLTGRSRSRWYAILPVALAELSEEKQNRDIARTTS